MALRLRPRESNNPPSGSQTITSSPTTDEQDQEGSGSASGSGRERENGTEIGVLRLRGGPVRRQRVVWAEEVIDNEGMGRKSSKSE